MSPRRTARLSSCHFSRGSAFASVPFYPLPHCSSHVFILSLSQPCNDGDRFETD